ncbi:ORF6N domain-containing protein [Acinetobacter sichuanensis]|uniref:ORF6N domain-containing protein n=1 Tax=Acinetobacter sichuanensis TaxID=2136183 RepID=A0A371YJH8_9GAMM|nr:ORF6N domain-containing protein [Acinetobacter sichuanensis]RFC81610.1 ORF6N domain-containing protein [Acinetobacter sichuanensis]
MPNIAQINDTQVSIINFKSIPVVTNEMLANFYGTDASNIRKNYSNNKARFIEGKHFFKIVGQELKDFMTSLKTVTSDLLVNNVHAQISSKTRVLTLWTERGAARHAKMLDTDQAWDIFEQLEDCYFNRQEILAKTHKSEREPLTNAVNMLVAKTKHLNYSDAYKLVHQRFNVKSIDEIPYDAIPVAVEYVHHLIALYSNAEKKQFSEGDLQNLHALATHMIWARSWWSEFSDFVKKLNPAVYSRATNHFNDGACLAWQFVKIEKKQELKECVDSFDWITGAYQQKLPI